MSISDKARLKTLLEMDHLAFTAYFYKQRTGQKFITNWHHRFICDEIDKVIAGTTKNLIINIAPGGSKTELVVIDLIARGFALNPNSRFLHLSYSDQLALLNSQNAKDIIQSDAYQELWPRKISPDTKSKKRWNIEDDNNVTGGVYATSIDGQVTGFRGGYMEPGFTGLICIDDPLKTEDAFSATKLESANRRLLTTVESRRARPDTPVIMIMQRLAEQDPVGFIESGGLPGEWKIVKIPALLDQDLVNKYIPEKYHASIDKSVQDDRGRFSYWQFKEPIDRLVQMERGGFSDDSGNAISRYVFNSQYQQQPTSVGGNVIKGADFVRYSVLPMLKYRKIYADTAQKTAEHNDFSVFECWGIGHDNRIYLLDLIRGKWESPELKRRARAFWAKHSGLDWESNNLGSLREMLVEDKSSGTDVIQTLKVEPPLIPIKGIERSKDKYTRVMDALPYIEGKMVCIPENAAFVNDFVQECEMFRSDMTHKHDDMIDPLCDAIYDMLTSQNRLKLWERLA